MTTTEAEAFWEDRYRSTDRIWSGRPNAVLVDVVSGLEPGRVLDLGCGEGGDAVWLARQGWQVTAVDISAVALDRVREHAADAGVQVTTERHELGVSTPTGEFDLVTAFFLQSPVALPRAQALRAIADTVVPGGRLLLVDHGSAAPWMWNHHDHDHVFASPRELYDEIGLDPALWTPERLDTPSREATGPNGETAPILDSVVLARRI